MCYDISFGTKYELITDYLPDIIIDPQIDMSFPNVLHVQAQDCSPYPIIMYRDGQYHLTPLTWGVSIGPKFMAWNTMAEKIIGDKKSYWHRIRQFRCLIPLAGIFEHRSIKGWKKKVPYYVQQKGRSLMGIPALYSPEQNAFSMVTRKANGDMELIHNDSERGFRMPLFLPKSLELKWLDPTLMDDQIQEILDYEIPSEGLVHHPVATIRTSKPHPTGGLKTDPYDWPKLPPLGQDTNELFLF